MSLAKWSCPGLESLSVWGQPFSQNLCLSLQFNWWNLRGVMFWPIVLLVPDCLSVCWVRNCLMNPEIIEQNLKMKVMSIGYVMWLNDCDVFLCKSAKLVTVMGNYKRHNFMYMTHQSCFIDLIHLSFPTDNIPWRLSHHQTWDIHFVFKLLTVLVSGNQKKGIVENWKFCHYLLAGI